MELLTRKEPLNYPVRVVQFGEGNFMRAFIDWMIDEMNAKTDFRSAVQVIQPRGGEKAMPACEKFNAQGGLYTLILRGVEGGKVVERNQVIQCVKGFLNATEHWGDIVKLFQSPDLRFCFSNTTDAGIEYKPEPFAAGGVQQTFPAKLASLLYVRFQAGLPGLILLPCELIDNNGTALLNCIMHYASDWQFGKDFERYIAEQCIFCNTLVDRIVAGYPKLEADAICQKLGYIDHFIDCAEPFHFFVVEAPDAVRAELPFEKAGLNVLFTQDQTPYHVRKVRFLNGAHTGTVLAAYLAGFDYVDEVVNDAMFGKFMRSVLMDEVYPTVHLPDEEKRMFADAVLERFANPFAFHRLLSISLNSVSKWKVRVLPTLLDYQKMFGKLPPLLAFSLAALIAFYRNQGGIGTGRVNPYSVSDAPEIVSFFELQWRDNSADLPQMVKNILAMTSYWSMDLNDVPGLSQLVTDALKNIVTDGIRLAVRGVLK